MPYYRTAKFKAHDPSGHKLRCVKSAVRAYSEDYCEIMNTLRPHEAALAEDTTKSTLREKVRGAIDTTVSGALREGLIDDAVTNLMSYFELDGASFPGPSPQTGKPVDELLDRLTTGIPSLETENQIKWGLRREPEEYTRPISFCRFRNAPILRSDDGERLWIAAQIRNGGKKSYIPAGAIREMTGLPGVGYTKRYILFPIECGRWHMHRFFREGTPKSCKVQVKGDDVFFHYAFEFNAQHEEPEAVVGVDRGRAITGAWATVGMDGQRIQAGASMQQDVRDRLKGIDEKIADAQNRGADESELWGRRRRFVKHTLHHIANRIVDEAERHNALIAFEDLENIKGATGSSNLDRGLKRSQYGRLYDYVEYKAEERGLRLVEVAPQYTSQTCPCGVTDPDSRLSRDTFQCMACGYEEHADLNAAHMIALRGLEYITGGGHESFGHFVSQLDLR